MAELQNISRVIREVNKHHIHLMAICKQENNLSWLPAWEGQGSWFSHQLPAFSGTPRNLCLLPQIQSPCNLACGKKLKERWRTAHQCPLAGVGGGGSILKGIVDPLPLEFLKKKGNLLLAGTVLVEVFSSWCLIEISCAIPSTDLPWHRGGSR